MLFPPRRKAVAEIRRRTGGRVMSHITGAEHRPYKEAVLGAYGVEAATTPNGLPVRAPHTVAPPPLCYATVPKVRRLGRVVEVMTRLVFGTAAALAAALQASAVSRAVNVSFLERQHLTGRHRDARRRRETYGFSKTPEGHEAATHFTPCRDNGCWPVRTLCDRPPGGPWRGRTPAMAAGLTDHVWTLAMWLHFPAVKLE